VKIVHHGHRKLRDGQTIILGHEFVGVIERVGARVTGWRAGQRVGVAPNMGCGHCEMCARGLGNMCPDYSAFGIDRDGSHTELVRIPAAALAQNLVIALPPEIRPQDGAMAEPLSCACVGRRPRGGVWRGADGLAEHDARGRVGGRRSDRGGH
jgi:threonine dehydrogenase-like Zn-dependent dehydrogenase